MDGEEKKVEGCFIAVIALQAVLLALMFLGWMLVVSHPIEDPEDAWVSTSLNVSMIGSLVAFGGLVAAGVSHWPRWPTLTAGASYVAVAAGVASGDAVMIFGAILLAVLPSALLMVTWHDSLDERRY